MPYDKAKIVQMVRDAALNIREACNALDASEALANQFECDDLDELEMLNAMLDGLVMDWLEE